MSALSKFDVTIRIRMLHVYVTRDKNTLRPWRESVLYARVSGLESWRSWWKA